jgi:hypothetical protein
MAWDYSNRRQPLGSAANALALTLVQQSSGPSAMSIRRGKSGGFGAAGRVANHKPIDALLWGAHCYPFHQSCLLRRYEWQANGA